MVSHTAVLPVSIYVPTPGGPPPKKVRRLQVETFSLRQPIHVIEIVDDTPMVSSPVELASSSLQATPEYEDYFAVAFPTAGAADDTLVVALPEVFVAAVTARLEGHD